MHRQDRLLPIAILGAGALIGAGLFFGLQRRGADPAPASGASNFVPERPDAAAAIDARGASQELRARVGGQVLEALEKDRARLVRACWTPSSAKQRDPKSQTFQLRFEFGPTGKRSASAVGDPDSPSRLDVSQCLREQDLVAAVPPPGTVVAVEVRLTLP